MDFNPFKAISDYPGMINKIATFTFFFSIFAIMFLRYQIPLIDRSLEPFSIPIKLGGFSLPLGTIMPAFLIALISRIFKLHDRISDFLKLRHRFDVYHVLLPMALASQAMFLATDIELIEDNRIELMDRVFYRYASSSRGKAVIDSHYVTMALDQWSWYWIVVECSFVSALTSFILFFGGKEATAFLLFIITLIISILLLIGIHKNCSRYALREIDQILSDQERKREVTEVFNALQSKGHRDPV